MRSQYFARVTGNGNGSNRTHTQQPPAVGVPLSVPKLTFANIGESSDYQRNPAAAKTVTDDFQAASAVTEFPQQQTNLTRASEIVSLPMAAAHIPQHNSDAGSVSNSHHNNSWPRSALPVHSTRPDSISSGSSTGDAVTILPPADGHQHDANESPPAGSMHSSGSNNDDRLVRCQLLCKVLARRMQHARQNGSSDLSGGRSTTARPHHVTTLSNTTYSSTDSIQLPADPEMQVAAGTPVLSSRTATIH